MLYICVWVCVRVSLCVCTGVKAFLYTYYTCSNSFNYSIYFLNCGYNEKNYGE